jgi:hypothetical protein
MDVCVLIIEILRLKQLDHFTGVKVSRLCTCKWCQHVEFLYVGTWYTSRECWTWLYVGSFDPVYIRNGIMPHLWGINLSHIYAREVR